MLLFLATSLIASLELIPSSISKLTSSKIEIVGLRPGEKLFEELSYNKSSIKEDYSVHRTKRMYLRCRLVKTNSSIEFNRAAASQKMNDLGVSGHTLSQLTAKSC